MLQAAAGVYLIAGRRRGFVLAVTVTACVACAGDLLFPFARWAGSAAGAPGLDHAVVESAASWLSLDPAPSSFDFLSALASFVAFRGALATPSAASA